MAEKSLYYLLGCVFAIAVVVNRFSDEIVKNRTAGQVLQNPVLREGHTLELERYLVLSGFAHYGFVQ